MTKNDISTQPAGSMQNFVGEIKKIISDARTNAVRSVDFCRVQMYWNISRRIVEEEQHGKATR
jgi:hypothetical protein